MRFFTTPLLLALVLGLFSSAWALQANLAGVVDWHTQQVGQPILGASPPAFVDTSSGKRLLLTITHSNVFAALDGPNIVWRHLMADDDVVLRFNVHGDSVLLLSGPSGSTARMFELETGRLRWEKRLEDPSKVRLLMKEYPAFGTDVAFAEDSVLVLSDGRRVTKLDMRTGEDKWSFEFPTQGGTETFKQIMVNGKDVTVLSISNAAEITALSHLVLNLDTMFPFSEMSHIQSALKPELGFLVRGTDGGMRAVWTELHRVRVAKLHSDGEIGEIKDHFAGTGRRYTRLVDVGLREYGYMLGELMSGAMAVVEIGDSAKLVSEFKNAATTGQGFPVYSAAKIQDGFLFTRVYYSFEHEAMRAQNIAVGPAGVTPSEQTVEFDMSQHGTVTYAAINATGKDSLPSFAILSSSSSLQGNVPVDFVGKTTWVREESLADIVEVRFVNLGEPETEEALELLADESFVHRVTRHITELRQLPGYIARFASRMTSSVEDARTPPLVYGNVHRDQFGLTKLIVAVTAAGKVFALDSGNGNVVWSRNLGYFTNNGPELDVFDMQLTRNLSEAGNPQLTVIATRHRDNFIHTMGFHIDAFTGEVAGEKDERFGVPRGTEIFGGKPKKVFMTPYENCCTKNRVLAVIDPKYKLHIFPQCKKVAAALDEAKETMFFSLVENSMTDTSLRGFAPSKRGENLTFETTELWSRPFLAQEVLTALPTSPSVIASFGRALGDKDVLYKYLNPHLTVVTTFNPLRDLGRVFVIDSTTGATIHEVTVPNLVGANLHAAMIENWLVYGWLEGQSPDNAGGWRIASVDLFEEEGEPHSAGRSNLASTPRVKAISQSWIMQSDIKAFAFTTSQFGVTTKDLLYLNSAGQVAQIPRRMLDPRRPLGKPTKAEQEEMLIPYDPLMPNPASSVVSHSYPVLGLLNLVTSPTLLESTSFVFAFGLDLFSSRALQPAGTFDMLGSSFNKAQLLITLAALGVGVAVAAPAVARKTLRAKWF